MNQPLVNIQGAQITSSPGQVAHALGRGIVLGRHREGELLPAEADLMKQFGTSRTVLREAIKMLAAKGMVVSRSKVGTRVRSEEHTSELQSLMRISYAVFCLKKKIKSISH